MNTNTNIIWAKCINKSQIAKDKAEFLKRQAEEQVVYCEGEISKSKNGQNTLCCVPLNLVCDCVKYGTSLAIVRCDVSGEYTDTLPTKTWLATDSQYVIKIFDLNNPDTIDYIFDMVGDASVVHGGYIGFLSQESQDRFRYRKKNG